MKLRLKLIIILSILVGGLIGILYIFGYTAVFSRYQILEHNEVAQELDRVGKILDEEISRIDSITNDWAAWDDTYSFITDLNQGYIDSNLVEGTFTTNGLNVMLFYDSSGTLKLGKAYDLEQGVETGVPAFFEGDIRDQGLLTTAVSEHARGKLSLPEGTLLFSSRPIITSMDQGPVRGTLIMGRFLDAEEPLRITEILGIEVDIRRIGDPSLPTDFQRAISAIETGSAIEVTPISREHVTGYTTLKDYKGAASLVLKITLPRDIYIEGEVAVQSFMVSFIFIGLGVGAVVLAINDWLFVKPIVSLSKKVAAIGRKQDFDERLPVVGDDERASLSRDINTMLDSLNEAKEREIDQREKVEEIKRGHIKELLEGARRITNSVRYDLRSPLQVIKNATYLLREDPKRADSLADMIDESVESAVSTIEDLSSMTQTGELKITVTDLRYLIELSLEAAKVPENVKVVKEFLDVVRGSGVRGIASHLRGRVISYPGGTIGEDPSIQAMLIQEARLEGHEVFVDVIPIVSGLNSLVGVLFGGWGITDFSEIFDDEEKMVPIKTFVHKLSDIQKKKLVSEKARAHASSTGLYTRDDTRLIHYSPSHPEFIGKSVSEAAESFGLNVLDAIIKLTIDDCGDTRWGNTCLENDLKALFSYDFTMPCTDGYWLPYSAEIPSMAAIPGPRIYGSFPYFLKTYQSDSLTIEKVVEKMTSLPAHAFRLKGRGVLKEGAYADIVVFDPIQIRNNATYKNPMIPPSGIKYVIVNGTLAYSKGTLTTGAGKVLKKVHDM